MARRRQRDVQVDADAEGELNGQQDQEGQVGLPQAGLAGFGLLRGRRGRRLWTGHVGSPPLTGSVRRQAERGDDAGRLKLRDVGDGANRGRLRPPPGELGQLAARAARQTPEPMSHLLQTLVLPGAGATAGVTGQRADA
jgi:hypothetical protein